jgi:hypothetical protein
VAKNFPLIGEATRLTFKAGFFNLFNHTNARLAVDSTFFVVAVLKSINRVAVRQEEVIR